MKVGIVTYFDIVNYGSVLQAYAMKTVLQRRGVDPCFLNIRETRFLEKYAHKAYVGAVTVSKMALYANARSTHKEIRQLKSKTQQSISAETRDAFRAFVNDNLPSTTISRNDLKKRAYSDEYYAFICGSDQIWSPLSLHLPSYKFLEFAPEEKRIAYAPSFGVEYIPEYNLQHIKKAIGKMNAVSVRETKGAELIETLTSVRPPVVLDPTMLLTGDEWRREYSIHVTECKSKPYVLVYCFEEPEESVLEELFNGAESRNLDVVVVMEGNHSFISRGAKYVAANPWMFLYLVDHAEYVVTNSFHGCVFSTLFDRPFTALDRAHSDSVKQTSRISTLLEMAGLTSYHYERDNLFHAVEAVDYKYIEEKRKESLAYLFHALDMEK